MSPTRLPLDLGKLAWPAERLGEAVEWLARRAGLSTQPTQLSCAPPAAANPAALDCWLDAAALALGLEVEPIEGLYSEAKELARKAAPAILRVEAGPEIRFLAVLFGGHRAVTLLTPDLGLKRCPVDDLRAALCHPLEAPWLKGTQALLDQFSVVARRQPAASAVLLQQQLMGTRVKYGWLLRHSPGASLFRLARAARVPSRLVALLAAHGAQYLLWLFSWWLIGQAALQGRFDWGWLTAWALVLCSMLPFRLLVTWLQGWLSFRLGALLKQRLLLGALHLQPEEIRHQGAGQILACVIESEAVESLALSGGFLGVMAVMELAMAAVVMAAGPAAAWELGLLAACLTVALTLAWRYTRDRNWWTQARLELTHDFVERMVGHRTRLAQERRARWHEGEDAAVSGLQALARDMDGSARWLSAFVPRSWLLLGLAALTPAFALANTPSAELAVGLGGVLLAFRALQRLTGGLSALAGAAIAWKQIAPLFRAASRQLQSAEGATALLVGGPGSEVSKTGSPPAPSVADRNEKQEFAPLLEAHDLNFAYRDRGQPVLRDCSLTIHPGDRLILEGPSGGGKSTLASLLAGLRVPDSGLLLLRGLDRQTLGLSAWRRHVAAAPQFHENHVLTATFAFNLLMGRQWPPQPEDLLEAEALCCELGLADLLQRMPAGLLQPVGESGWQLSHGEKSRLYIARALLQGADLVVLDESFASLDPENLRRALTCVQAHARSLLVVAHP